MPSTATSRKSSSAERFRLLPKKERARRYRALSDEEKLRLKFDWAFWGRQDQKIPRGKWRTWLICAGRGWGKTRTGAEAVRAWIKAGFNYVNIIAPTADDVRDVCIEGESGILAICPPDERPVYKPSIKRLIWPNGAISRLFTADEPERLRGKQHQKLWADELGSWRFQKEAWTQAMFGLRLGRSPQACVTSTPKPTMLFRDLYRRESTHLTIGTSYENRANLAKEFLDEIITQYEGTRIGRQELLAELLEDNPDALFHLKDIDADRVGKLPDNLTQVVIAIDPATTSNENSNECGLVGAARDDRWPPHYYVFVDASDRMSPDKWGSKAVALYHDYDADRIIGEKNQGGDMIETILRTKDAHFAYRGVTATRGKIRRAEPIAGLYEQHRVHHVGNFAVLEDQMCNYNPRIPEDQQISPDRMDALVWALTFLVGKRGLAGLHAAYRQLEQEQENEAAGKPARPDEEKKMRPIKPKVDLSTLEKPTTNEKTKACPNCQKTCIVRIAGGQLRCGECGHQWGEAHTASAVPQRLKK
jgi:phage terminase large subunit-like protein